MSSKIHPSENQKSSTVKPGSDQEQGLIGPSVLTVWKRSSMSFQGTDGFTVFDNHGRLVFRVDNYTRKSWSVGGGGLLLMDGSGRPLLTLKPQFLRMQHQWIAFRGELEDEACSSSSRLFTMRRPTSPLISRRSHCPCEAQVFLESGENMNMMTISCRKRQRRQPDFKCEGSFRRRTCKISVAATGQVVANISRKRITNTTLLLKDDVFALTVEPGFDPAVVMAFVIVLDRICCKTFVPVLCSY